MSTSKKQDNNDKFVPPTDTLAGSRTNAKPEKSTHQRQGSKKRVIWLGIVLILLLSAVMAGIFLQPKKELAVPAPNISTTAPTSIVKITQQGFDPAVLKVKKGTTVIWTNEDDPTTHQIASNPHPVHNGLKDLRSNTLKSHESYNYHFGKTGSFSYHDEQKPEMNGTIIVE